MPEWHPDEGEERPRTIRGRYERVLESTPLSNLLMISLFILLALPLVGISLLTTSTIAPRASEPSAAVASTSTTYACDGGKRIDAVYVNSEAELSLSDGRDITLPRVASAIGTRYSNPNGSFVFDVSGDAATIRESGQTTYAGCIASR